MSSVLYDLMDWAEIEAVVYSEQDQPKKILGPHVTKHGVLVQAFVPYARKLEVKVKKTGELYPMELMDEEGFYAVLLPEKKIPEYTLCVTYGDGQVKEMYDAYSLPGVITEKDKDNFSKGIHYNVYDVLGAHPMKLNGVSGTNFAVWAPNAIRVSVVGDFNSWDGRTYQMERLGDSGIFELFIPGVFEEMIYKYEIKVKGGLPILKADPYAFGGELRPNTASVVWSLDHHKWKDAKWLEKRKKTDLKKAPMAIYELHLGSWKKPEVPEGEEDSAFYNYRELAPMIAEYVKKMNYTHIELMPIMEHPFDGSWGYQVTGYYAATARYGTPEDFMYFVDYMHNKGIGVILDWVPAHFPRDAFGLANFDGTCLYEHLDPRQGSHPHWGTLIYNYGRPQVSNFLIANALFWVDKYHVDGIRMDAVASMLYLDYGKNDGEWVANKYGGNGNLEAMDMLKHLNSVFKKRKDGAIVIAEESTAWPKITGDLKDDGMGFDYKWNMGWMNDFTNYMKTDPLFRKGNHGALTFSMVYAYSENFILVLSHDEVVHGKGSMINKMPGEYEQKFANLRAAYGFMMTHPGKKLLFMGQDFAQFSEWNEEKSLEWELVDQYDSHRQMQSYVSALNALYQKYPAFYQLDCDPKGFEWINCDDAEKSIVSFVRKTSKKDETMLVVCNFTPVVREDFGVGVPFAGKYKEIFNSDDVKFGGEGNTNPRVKTSKKQEWDGYENSIRITVPPLGIAIFTCTPGKTAAKKTTTKAAEKKATEAKTVEKKAEKKTVKKAAETKIAETKEVEVKEPEKKADKPENAVIEAVIKAVEKAAKKLETKKEEPVKLEDKKPETKKLETKKEEPVKLEDKKPETKKLETKKEEPAKIEDKKPEVKKLETTKEEPAKLEDKKPEEKKPATKKATKKAGKGKKKKK